MSPTQQSYRVLALYKFVEPRFEKAVLGALQKELDTTCRKFLARGCLVVAPEGINGTISYPVSDEEKKDDNLLKFFKERFPGLRIRTSDVVGRAVFDRLKVKLKKEIVTLSTSDGRFPTPKPTENVGTYVKPGQDWDKMLSDPDCLVVDTRNDYEIRVGTFKNAVNPSTETFSDFPSWLEEQVKEKKPKKIAMFCTGGIRCEKSTSMAKQQFPDTTIYHLEGGILGYLDAVSEENSMFEGECFVFDQRVAVTHGLKPSSTYTRCFGCRNPISEVDKLHPDYVEGQSCPYCISKTTQEQRTRYRERHHQVALASKVGANHIYDPKDTKRFA